MKTKEEIKAELQRLRAERNRETRRFAIINLHAKVEALEWVLGEEGL